MSETCERCKHFHRYPDRDQGDCMRYPPQLVPIPASEYRAEARHALAGVESFHQRWPIVVIRGTCGEWAVRP